MGERKKEKIKKPAGIRSSDLFTGDDFNVEFILYTRSIRGTRLRFERGKKKEKKETLVFNKTNSDRLDNILCYR